MNQKFRIASITSLLGLAGIVLFLISPYRAFAAPPAIEKPRLVLAVGGQQSLPYLALNVAWKIGAFKAEGLDVDIQNLSGGGDALKALIGGSADVVSGFYDHVIQMQARGEKVRAVVLQQRYPVLVLIVSPQAVKAGVKTVRDLKGKTIGVSALGSSTHFFVNHVLGQAGLKPEDFSVMGVGVGTTAVAAFQSGKIDALSVLEPSLTMLQQSGRVGAILADTRTKAGSEAVFGGAYPSATVYVKEAFLQKNPRTVQAVVNAMIRALEWQHSHSAEDVAKLMPPEYLQGNRPAFVQAVNNMLDSYSPDGRVDLAAVTNLVQVLGSDPKIKAANISVPDTYDPQFVEAYWRKQKAIR